MTRRPLDSLADDRLVTLARAGDRDAFGAIVKRYGPELRARARHLASDERADDLVQQTFLNAWIAIGNGSQVRHLRGWMHEILRNAVIRGRCPVESQLDPAQLASEPLEVVIQQRAAARAALDGVSRLPARQRDALIGTAVHGVARSHLAVALGVSEGAVRQLVHRARTTLRQAAAAIFPLPLLRPLLSLRDLVGDSSLPAALGGGSAAASLAKAGAVVSSGLIAAGLATGPLRSGQQPRRDRHAPHAAVAMSEVRSPIAARTRLTLVTGSPAAGILAVSPGGTPEGAARSRQVRAGAEEPRHVGPAGDPSTLGSVRSPALHIWSGSTIASDRGGDPGANGSPRGSESEGDQSDTDASPHGSPGSPSGAGPTPTAGGPSAPSDDNSGTSPSPTVAAATDRRGGDTHASGDMLSATPTGPDGSAGTTAGDVNGSGSGGSGQRQADGSAAQLASADRSGSGGGSGGGGGDTEASSSPSAATPTSSGSGA